MTDYHYCIYMGLNPASLGDVNNLKVQRKQCPTSQKFIAVHQAEFCTLIHQRFIILCVSILWNSFPYVLVFSNFVDFVISNHLNSATFYIVNFSVLSADRHGPLSLRENTGRGCSYIGNTILTCGFVSSS